MSEARPVHFHVHGVARDPLFAARVAAAAAVVVVVVIGCAAAVVAVVGSGAEKVEVAGFDLCAWLRLLFWYPLFAGRHGSQTRQLLHREGGTGRRRRCCTCGFVVVVVGG